MHVHGALACFITALHIYILQYIIMYVHSTHSRDSPAGPLYSYGRVLYAQACVSLRVRRNTDIHKGRSHELINHILQSRFVFGQCFIFLAHHFIFLYCRCPGGPPTILLYYGDPFGAHAQRVNLHVSGRVSVLFCA